MNPHVAPDIQLTPHLRLRTNAALNRWLLGFRCSSSWEDLSLYVGPVMFKFEYCSTAKTPFYARLWPGP